jgi:hypothetical protein
MISCRRASEWISQDLDRSLTSGRRVVLNFHRFLCKSCRRFGQQLVDMDDVVKDAIEQGELTAEPLSDSARERIRQTLSDETNPG